MTKAVTFEQISASLGSLLFLWAAIERAAREEVARVHGGCLPRSAHGIAAVLGTWEAIVIAAHPEASLRALLAAQLRADIQKPLSIRNGLCHGLIGISSGRGGRTATLTWEINDMERSITWEEMQGTLGWLSKIPWAISMISSSQPERVGARMTDTPATRQWWREEFGLDVLAKSAG